MKYCILGFSQNCLVQSGIKKHNIDLVDLFILEWFSDWASDRTMCTKTVEENDTKRTFYWVDYKNVSEEFPFFGGSTEYVRKRFAKMVKAGLLARKVVRRKDDYHDENGKRRTRKVVGTLTYFAIEPLYYNLRAATKARFEGLD